MAESTPALVSMAQQFSGLPMNALIGGPLMAAAEANQSMALTQVDFLMDTCFNKTTTGTGETAVSTYTPRMVDMTLTRSVIQPSGTSAAPTITEESSSMNLPLLTILPLNSLAVDSVTIDFTMEVKSSFSEDHSQTKKSSSSAEGKFSATVGIGWFSATVSGSVSTKSSDTSTDSTHYAKSNTATYSVNVHAGQLPLPQGVTTIIDAYTQAIAPIQLPAPAAPKVPPT